ncbi:partial Poly(3-hydroxyalkanoate) polymerase subunit PhaC, partial [Burkholderiales bacterium]
VIVVDPRAGHGPGIGGFKRDSEVGMALLEGHAVYFVVFDPDPVEGQTLGAVIASVARFIDIVAQRHRGAPPIVYGNCQGGWAVTMALSHCERQVGLAVLNGSPLSYWAGELQVNPMRLAGGFTGGAWLVHWLADLGDGRFDGAWLVQNFESLRPEAVFSKYDTLFAHPEAERERFLEFERWWGGFYFLGREEILSIVRDLFIGNRLQTGEVMVDAHCHADLKRIRSPLVLFSSHGDNITPPHQALAWLRSVYPATQDLIAAGQRIVYLTHPSVGHLGIFVSASTARREHRAVLHHAKAIGALPPGLYEMLLDDGDSDVAAKARFEPRRLEEVVYEPNPAGFERVRTLSEQLDTLYTRWISPWVQAMAAPASARLLEQLHPMRTSRLMWSPQVVPALAWLPWLRSALEAAGAADPQRDGNPWYAAERSASQAAAQFIESWRVMRDHGAEAAFEALYPR